MFLHPIPSPETECDVVHNIENRGVALSDCLAGKSFARPAGVTKNVTSRRAASRFVAKIIVLDGVGLIEVSVMAQVVGLDGLARLMLPHPCL
ncbi:hypothetical protein EDC38_1484 [Marinimicrobium koreense]|uniref:Uncharacterized protein n=1 Tax=Marinimicrobium koreense TaxID=306545 RepID=A0A3N1P810_9GAMM|nr:hypothetical protein EDC38_1484 [Marinimicrobium koreense]